MTSFINRGPSSRIWLQAFVALLLLFANLPQQTTAFQPSSHTTFPFTTTTTATISTNNDHHLYQTHTSSSLSLSSPLENENENEKSLSNMATSRFPTSPEDQVRQASIALAAASDGGITRHSIRLLLPVIGATELDDWPGGARQMMEAASPLIQDVLKLVNKNNNDDDGVTIQESVVDQSDGVRALFSQGQNPQDDACAVLLPSADTVTPTLLSLDEQVGPKRNLLFVNSQWRRQSDFSGDGVVGGLGSFFGSGGGNNKNSKDEKIEFIEGFEPTFHCSNVMVEGDIIRVLRTYPGPWRVYLRVVLDDENQQNDGSNIDWVEIGQKDLVQSKTAEWEAKVMESGDYDGGKLFDYGIPSYKEIETMIVSREGYVPKSLSERAASAFIFIKDSL